MGASDRKFGMSMYLLLYLKWITNKDLLYRTWNSAQCYVAHWMGGAFGGEWVHVYVWMSPFFVHVKWSQHCLLIGYTPIQNKKFFFSFKWLQNSFVFLFHDPSLLSDHTTSCPNFLAPPVLFLVSQCRKLFLDTGLLNISFLCLCLESPFSPLFTRPFLNQFIQSHSRV